MQQLSTVAGLVITQKKEWGEILSGFETKNRYAVLDESGNTLYLAAEADGSLLMRLFLRALRPFTMVVLATAGHEVIRINRPFRFYFHRAEVVDGEGNMLGVIEKQFSLLRRKYVVMNSAGELIFELFGPILHPWTFQIRHQEVEYGKITKKWSGLLKEGFTDADNFGIIFPEDWDIRLKALFLGAVFLIDFVHFENKGRS